MRRRIRAERLRQLIRAKGEYGLEQTAQGARISSSTLEKMMADAYDSGVRDTTAGRLLGYFGVSEGWLFELVEASSKSGPKSA